MRAKRVPSWLVPLALASAVGCSSDKESDAGAGGGGGSGAPCGGRGDVFSAGMSRSGEESAFTFTLENATPAPPQVFDNTWLLSLDAAGAAVPGASLTVTTWMPDHGHGSPKQTLVADLGDGRYELSPVNLSMPGLWEVTLSAQSATASDQVTFSFCVG